MTCILESFLMVWSDDHLWLHQHCFCSYLSLVQLTVSNLWCPAVQGKRLLKATLKAPHRWTKPVKVILKIITVVTSVCPTNTCHDKWASQFCGSSVQITQRVTEEKMVVLCLWSEFCSNAVSILGFFSTFSISQC